MRNKVLELWIGVVLGAIATAGFLFLFGRSRVLRPFVNVYDVGHETIQSLVMQWIDRIETAETKTVCLCPWEIHPDDVHLKTGRRMRRTDNHPRCPVHTKEGYLLGFLEWVNKRYGD